MGRRPPPRLDEDDTWRPETFFGDPRQGPTFALDERQRFFLTCRLRFAGIDGIAAHYLNDDVVVGDQLVPQKIIFRAFRPDGGQTPWLTMGIEVLNGVPQCTYLALAADAESEVRAKQLKAIRVDDWVAAIATGCANVNVESGTLEIHKPEWTHEQQRDIERAQRRRSDPRSNRALLDRVAELYRANSDAPNMAVAAEFGVSVRTAARWAGYASEAGLLPKGERGKKRL